jgi:hypothetical protein
MQLLDYGMDVRGNLVLFQAGTRDSFLLLTAHTGSGVHPTLYSVVIVTIFTW